jgi:putative SOS response-associated peptidase YedK
LKSRRCIVPADGFYEWARAGRTKQPYCFEGEDGELFAFAGLGERWKDPNGNWIRSCSILTTTPNAVTSGIHDRMPVILDPDAHDLWLNVPEQSDDALAQRHKPASFACLALRVEIRRALPVDSKAGTRPTSAPN